MSWLDSISNKILKYVGDAVAASFSHIINLSFSYGVFPSELKNCKNSSNFYIWRQQQFSNYRPISLLPSVLKLFERYMYNRIYSFVQKDSILNSFQYGFPKGYSTDMAR